MATEAPSSHELSAVGALRLLAGYKHHLLDLEEAVQAQSPLNGSQALLCEYSRRDEQPASGADPIEG